MFFFVLVVEAYFPTNAWQMQGPCKVSYPFDRHGEGPKNFLIVGVTELAMIQKSDGFGSDGGNIPTTFSKYTCRPDVWVKVANSGVCIRFDSDEFLIR